jgi:hypothetical protein
MSKKDDATYKKNTEEQYAALGRFVEAFESMVAEARLMCIEIIGCKRRQSDLANVALNHQCITAKPILDILRALIAEVMEDAFEAQRFHKENGTDIRQRFLSSIGDLDPIKFTIAERDTVKGVLKTIASEYEALANKRNNLLHATWMIGYVSQDDPNSEQFYVRKYSAGATGLEVIDLPKNATQLLELVSRCDTVRSWLAWLYSCLQGDAHLPITTTFQNHGKQWWLVLPNGMRTTLPEKQQPASA